MHKLFTYIHVGVCQATDGADEVMNVWYACGGGGGKRGEGELCKWTLEAFKQKPRVKKMPFHRKRPCAHKLRTYIHS